MRDLVKLYRVKREPDERDLAEARRVEDMRKRRYENLSKEICKALHLLNESGCGHNECIEAIGVLMNALPLKDQPDFGE